jgi:hypothetical protein
MAIRRGFKSPLIKLWLCTSRKFWHRRESAAPSVYLAFSIGSEMLAISVWQLDARGYEVALDKAAALFHEGLKRASKFGAVRARLAIPEASIRFAFCAIRPA